MFCLTVGHDEASGIRLKSKFRADILSEIADRIRYIDRIRTEGHETDNEVCFGMHPLVMQF